MVSSVGLKLAGRSGASLRDLFQAVFCNVAVVPIAIDGEEFSTQTFGDQSGGSGSGKRVQNDPLIRTACFDARFHQRFGVDREMCIAEFR